MRAAMMGGAGYAAGKHAQRSNDREQGQEARLESLEAQGGAPAQAPAAPAAAPAAGGGQDVVARLTELKGLLDAGALSQAEFDAAKAKVLGS
jgi:membrane protease subunit (stomatin/prohibitin family)